MSYTFRPAASFTERKGCFVALTGTTNSGKTYSALELATGLAGDKRVAVADTEGGRTLHLKAHFEFDALIMSPPFRPHCFAEVAKDAEDGGYGALLIDSFSMEWAGTGGVLDWQTEELEAAVQRAKARGTDRRSEYQIREANKMASWIKPKIEHKAMVLSFLNRRIPIIFSIRGEESVTPGENGGKPTKIYKSITSKSFPFEMTVAFRLAQDRKGYIDLSDPMSWKMEGDHQVIFRDGDRISREHGAQLAAWARGDAVSSSPDRRSTASGTVTTFRQTERDPGSDQEDEQRGAKARKITDSILGRIASATTADGLDLVMQHEWTAQKLATLRRDFPALAMEIDEAQKGKTDAFRNAEVLSDDEFPGDIIARENAA